MAHNDEAGGSGGKAFWELSQEMEENLTAMRTPPRKTLILTTQPLVASGMTPLMVPSRMPPLMVPPRMPPLMMAAHTQMATNQRSKGRTGARMRSAPSRRNLMK